MRFLILNSEPINHTHNASVHKILGETDDVDEALMMGYDLHAIVKAEGDNIYTDFSIEKNRESYRKEIMH